MSIVTITCDLCTEDVPINRFSDCRQCNEHVCAKCARKCMGCPSEGFHHLHHIPREAVVAKLTLHEKEWVEKRAHNQRMSVAAWIRRAVHNQLMSEGTL